jgi:hypothetical protein
MAIIDRYIGATTLAITGPAGITTTIATTGTCTAITVIGDVRL